MNPSYPGILGSPTRARKRRWPRILLRSFIGLLLIVVIATVAGVLWLRSAEKAALPASHIPSPKPNIFFILHPVKFSDSNLFSSLVLPHSPDHL